MVDQSSDIYKIGVSHLAFSAFSWLAVVSVSYALIHDVGVVYLTDFLSLHHT